MSHALEPAGTRPPVLVDGGTGAMFDRIARRYDRMNRVLSLGLDRGWRRRLLRAVAPLGPGDDVLDVATGTADVAIAAALRYPHARVTGLDPSAGMLAVGRDKVAAQGLADRVTLVPGDAQALPFPDAAFAAATIAFGIRNVPDRAQALREMARVVRRGGRVAVLELSEPRGRLLSPLARVHVHHVVPRLGAWLARAPEYRYLERSIAAFPPAGTFAALMQDSGLEAIAVTRLFMGVAHLYVGRVRAPA